MNQQTQLPRVRRPGACPLLVRSHKHKAFVPDRPVMTDHLQLFLRHIVQLIRFRSVLLFPFILRHIPAFFPDFADSYYAELQRPYVRIFVVYLLPHSQKIKVQDMTAL